MCAMEVFFHSAVLKLRKSPPRNALPGSFSMRVSRTESIYVNSPAVSRRRREGEIHDVFSPFLSSKAMEWFWKPLYNPTKVKLSAPAVSKNVTTATNIPGPFGAPCAVDQAEMTREVKFVLDVRVGSPNGSIVIPSNLRSFWLRI
jgi:hypothetical protein